MSFSPAQSSQKCYNQKKLNSMMNRYTADDAPLSEAEARIVAHVYADGYLCIYQKKRSPADLLSHPRKNKFRTEYEIGYCNGEKILLDMFSEDIKNIYGVRTRLFRDNTQIIKAKWIYQRLARFGAGKSREWFVSDEIFSADKVIIREWLKAFFDDEAYVEVKKNRICVNSVNLAGLKQVQRLLEKTGVKKTGLYGPYFYKGNKIYRLTVLKGSVEDYAKNVGFNHPKKAKDLDELLELRALSL